jgi:hypothetical protein
LLANYHIFFFSAPCCLSLFSPSTLDQPLLHRLLSHDSRLKSIRDR